MLNEFSYKRKSDIVNFDIQVLFLNLNCYCILNDVASIKLYEF